jgi:hypothetical protein
VTALAWLDSELERVLRKPVPRIELGHVRQGSARLVSPAAPNVASSVNASSGTYTYGPYDGPALSDDDVRRIEHPEEFR